MCESCKTSNLAAYYALPLWRIYLVALGRWEQAHEAYIGASGESLLAERRVALLAADKERAHYLARLRATPEHLAAFGWGGE